MQDTRLSWTRLTGQNDVLPGLRVPMVYEHVPVSPPNWEYHVLRVDMQKEQLPDEAALNELGQQGWLLVNIFEQRMIESSWYVHYYFVRQKGE